MDALFGNEKTAKIDKLVAELQKTPGWPGDDAKDRALVAELVEQFPGLDLEDQFGAFRVWITTKGTGKEVKSRGRWMRVRNWCKKAVDGRGAPGSTRSGPRRTSTAARPVEAFGSESSRSLTRW